MRHSVVAVGVTAFFALSSLAFAQSLYFPIAKAHNPTAGKTYHVNGDGVNLRKGAGSNYSIVKTVSRNVEVRFQELSTNANGERWYRVVYNDHGTEVIGYIAEKFMRAGEAPGEAEAACADGGCGTTKLPAAEAIENAVAEPLGYDLTKRITIDGMTSTECANRFMDRRGPNEWGKAVIQAVNKVAPKCFYETKIFDVVCPNYLNLSLTEKNAVIIAVHASIAREESTCRPTERNREGKNGVADGMFQLEESYILRRKADRNPIWCRTTGPTDSQDITFQTECTASTFADTYCLGNKFWARAFGATTPQPINHVGGYWEKMRKERDIVQNIVQTLESWQICKKP